MAAKEEWKESQKPPKFWRPTSRNTFGKCVINIFLFLSLSLFFSHSFLGEECLRPPETETFDLQFNGFFFQEKKIFRLLFFPLCVPNANWRMERGEGEKEGTFFPFPPSPLSPSLPAHGTNAPEERERKREREREKEREKERKEKQTAKVNCTGIQIAIFMAWKKGFFRRVLETIFFNQCLMKSDLISKLRTKLSSKKKVQLLYLFKQTSAMRASDLSSKFYTAENSMNVFSF